jgi:dUTP pyrophosphatase
MKIRIKRIDKSLPLPCYETAGSVGFDILAREDVVVAPGKISLIPGNVIVEVPDGYTLTIASRSSTPLKKGLLTPHGIGIIDHDYCGPDDEIKIQVYNFGDKDVSVGRGDKIAQGLFVRVDRFEWEEVSEVRPVSRGGFGSTDIRLARAIDTEGLTGPEEKKVKNL